MTLPKPATITREQLELVKRRFEEDFGTGECKTNYFAAMQALIAIGEQIGAGTHSLMENGTYCYRFPYCNCGGGLGTLNVCADKAMIAANEGEGE